MNEPLLSCDTWEASRPAAVRDDPLWHSTAYRRAAYAVACAGVDATVAAREAVLVASAEQLVRAVASIAANIAEGYSRSSGADRVRFYEYALGSAREAITWYETLTHVLGADTVAERQETLAVVRRLLLATIPRERRRTIRPLTTT